jgi:outer membrane protein assembly factor BamB
MKLTLLTGVSLAFIAMTTPKSKLNEPYQKIETNQRLIWKAKTGNACFRTNVELTDKYLVIGSNGEYFIDNSIYDKGSGVYVLDKATGRIVIRIAGDIIGDMDVAGVLVYNNKIYFGNDNEEFICTSLDGKEIWRNIASGDIEHQPSLIKSGNKTLVVYASELGEVCAVDPESGKKAWSYFTPNFNGWKEGENRAIFKVRAFFTNTASFYTKPLLVDLNKDGTTDLVYEDYSGALYAINGLNGKLLWQWDNKDEYIERTINLVKEDGKEYIVAPAIKYSSQLSETERYLVRFDLNGKNIVRIKFSDSGFNINLLNSLQTREGEIVYPGVDSIYVYKNSTIVSQFATGDSMFVTNPWDGKNINSRFYGDLLLGTDTFQFKDSKRCIALLSQRDLANYQHSIIEFVSLSDKKVIGRFELPASGEMPPQIIDINKDGKKELIVNCFDGYTYCYSLE